MNDKMKKYLVLNVYRLVFATVIFLIFLILGFFMPQTVEKVSTIWTKNTDFGRMAELLSEMIKELIPF